VSQDIHTRICPEEFIFTVCAGMTLLLPKFVLNYSVFFAKHEGAGIV
jgi:hypothetical protein